MRLAQQAADQRGIVIYLAARNRGSPLASPASGRFLGVAGAAIDMGDFMRGVLPRDPLEDEVEIFDVGMAGDRTPAQPSAANLAYDRDGVLDAPRAADTDADAGDGALAGRLRTSVGGVLRGAHPAGRTPGGAGALADRHRRERCSACWLPRWCTSR